MEGQCMSGNESDCEIFIVLCRVTQISRTWFYILVGVFFFFLLFLCQDGLIIAGFLYHLTHSF